MSRDAGSCSVISIRRSVTSESSWSYIDDALLCGPNPEPTGDCGSLCDLRCRFIGSSSGEGTSAVPDSENHFLH